MNPTLGGVTPGGVVVLSFSFTIGDHSDIFLVGGDGAVGVA